MITEQEMWRRLGGHEGKFFSVTFHRKRAKWGMREAANGGMERYIAEPVGSLRKMLCRRRVRRYTKGVIPPAVRLAEDVRCGVVTVWDTQEFAKLKARYLAEGLRPALSILMAGRNSYRRINLRGVVETSLPEVEVLQAV